MALEEEERRSIGGEGVGMGTDGFVLELDTGRSSVRGGVEARMVAGGTMLLDGGDTDKFVGIASTQEEETGIASVGGRKMEGEKCLVGITSTGGCMLFINSLNASAMKDITSSRSVVVVLALSVRPLLVDASIGAE